MENSNSRAQDSAERALVGHSARPWGFWATIGFSCVILLAYFAAAAAVIAVFVALGFGQDSSRDSDEIVAALMENGFAISLSMIVSAFVGLLILWLACVVRKNIKIADYLALKSFSLKALLFWVGILILFNLIIVLLSYAIQFQDMADLYWPLLDETRNRYIFLFAALVCAPVFEEAFFRGFLYRGLAESKMGVPGAIVLSSFVWSIIHLQYNLDILLIIFFLGVLFGLIRFHSGSVSLTMVLHAIHSAWSFAFIT
ncbi:MAG: type II CAAX endopeptidase family protein [Pseudomonadota bacterium]